MARNGIVKILRCKHDIGAPNCLSRFVATASRPRTRGRYFSQIEGFVVETCKDPTRVFLSKYMAVHSLFSVLAGSKHHRWFNVDHPFED